MRRIIKKWNSCYLRLNAQVDQDPFSDGSVFGAPGSIATLVQTSEFGVADPVVGFRAEVRTGRNLPIGDGSRAQPQQPGTLDSTCRRTAAKKCCDWYMKRMLVMNLTRLREQVDSSRLQWRITYSSCPDRFWQVPTLLPRSFFTATPQLLFSCSAEIFGADHQVIGRTPKRSRQFLLRPQFVHPSERCALLKTFKSINAPAVCWTEGISSRRLTKARTRQVVGRRQSHFPLRPLRPPADARLSTTTFFSTANPKSRNEKRERNTKCENALLASDGR